MVFKSGCVDTNPHIFIYLHSIFQFLIKQNKQTRKKCGVCRPLVLEKLNVNVRIFRRSVEKFHGRVRWQKIREHKYHWSPLYSQVLQVISKILIYISFLKKSKLVIHNFLEGLERLLYRMVTRILQPMIMVWKITPVPENRNCYNWHEYMWYWF